MSNESAALIAGLMSRIDRVVASARAEGHSAAMAEIRSLVGGDVAPVKRGPGRPRKVEASGVTAGTVSPRKPRKNSWSGLSPADRLARINAIRKGRGLPLKTSL
jgi:hypothetical protein